jgi:hypothetical protein
MESFRLDAGPHDRSRDGMCAMELAAWIAGEGHTSFPSGASGPLTCMVQLLNDVFDDEERQRLIPYALPLAHSRVSGAAERRRAAMATAWLEDEFPAFRGTPRGHEIAEAVSLAAGGAVDDRNERVLARFERHQDDATDYWDEGAGGETELIESVLELLDLMLDVAPGDVLDTDDGDAGVAVLMS